MAAMVPALDRPPEDPKCWPHGWALEEYCVPLFCWEGFREAGRRNDFQLGRDTGMAAGIMADEGSLKIV